MSDFKNILILFLLVLIAVFSAYCGEKAGLWLFFEPRNVGEAKSIDSSARCAVSDIWGTKLDCVAAKGYIDNSK